MKAMTPTPFRRRDLLQWGLSAGVASLLMGVSAFAGEIPASFVLTNGRVYTVNAEQPWAEAIAIRDDRIVAVGSDEEIAAFVGPSTRSADLSGRMVMPGLVDTHLHVMLGAAAKSGVWVAEIPTVDGVLKAIGDYARSHPNRDIIFGWGYGYSLFGPEGPSRERLDRAVPDRPAFIVREDGHSAWANTKALALAGIDASTPDPSPPAGVFGRDAAGNPTGAINGGPANLWTMTRLPGAITTASLEQAARPIFEHITELGITTVFDAGAPVATKESFRFLTDYDRNKGLPFRYFASHYINSASQAEDAISTLKSLDREFRTDNFRLQALKITVDGVVENRKAAMLEPYDDGTGSGALNFTPEVISSLSQQAAADGYDIYMHTLGDRAVRVGLDVAAAVRKAGHADTMITLSHCQIVDPEDRSRFKASDVVINSTGGWMTPYPGDVEVLGDRASQEFPLRSMINDGVLFVNSSDFPATPVIDPFTHLEVSITRREPGADPAQPAKNPDSALTFSEAIEAYTINGATMLKMEEEIGSLEPGKKADLIVLNQNLAKIPANRIHSTKVLLTMMNGKVQHDFLYGWGYSNDAPSVEFSTGFAGIHRHEHD